MKLLYRVRFIRFWSASALALFSGVLLTSQAAPPLITGFEPKTAVPGASITVRGENFSGVAEENIVYFGAVRGTVTSPTTTNLQVTVPPGATFAPITVTVNGLTAASPQPFLPTFPGAGDPIGSGTLQPVFTMAAPLGPTTIVFADLDNDGLPDMVVGNGRASSIWVLRNIGSNSPLSAASFDAPVQIPNPPAIYKIRAADVDGDGKLDLIVASVGSAQVWVHRNVTENGGPIAFAPRVELQTGADCRFARAADLDGDGKLDIVTANYGDNTVSILKNIGAPGAITTNSFAPHIDLPAPTGPYELAIGDVDGDGRPDIALAAYGQVISVYVNGCAGGVLDSNSFTRLDFPAPAETDTIELGDVDGDGLLDVVVGSVAPNLVAVYRNLGIAPFSTNSLAPRVEFFNGHWVHNVTLADFDGDGKADVAVDGELPSYLSIYQNLAAPGSFTTQSLGARVDVATGWNAWGLAVGDLDGDGRPDAAVANFWDNTFTVYRNVSPFSSPPFIISQPADQVVALGDPAAFSIYAQGSPDLAYQWSHGDAPLPGATGSSLVLAETREEDAGPYSVVVTNTFGAVTSSIAVLAFTNTAPYIAAQPQDLSLMRDETAVFSVGARGTRPLYYQWRVNGTNLAAATDSALTLPSVQRNQAGLYSVLVSNTLGTVVSRDARLTVRIPPSGVVLMPTTNISGWPVTVPVRLNASGEENALSFSIVFGGPQRASPLKFTSASTGASAQGAWLVVNTNDLAFGRVGVALALPAGDTFARGMQEVALLEFETTVTTSMPILFALGFADQPVARQVADPLAVSLPAFFTNGPITLLPTDIEGDTSPRPDGNRSLTINDWVQAGRFVAGLDEPATPTEFQRVDCAPRATRGDGTLKVTDWVQAGRYFAKLDPLTALGGPTGPGASRPPGLAPAPKDLGRAVRVLNTEGYPGLEVIVPLQLQAQGDENGLGFTLRFDPARLQFAAAALGTDAAAAGASFNVNALQAGSGSVGLLLALPAGAAFNPGARQVLNLAFVPQPGVAGSVALEFGDAPILRAVSDAAANELAASYVGGAVTLTPLPKLGIALSGTNLVLSWPAAAVGFELQSSLRPGPDPGWTNLLAAPQTNANTLSVTLPIADEQRFFRLHHP